VVRVQTGAGARVFPPQEMEQDLYQDNTGQYSWHRERDRHRKRDRSDKNGKEKKTKDCRGIEREELFGSNAARGNRMSWNRLGDRFLLL
jgi:hypothetical protein